MGPLYSKFVIIVWRVLSAAVYPKLVFFNYISVLMVQLVLQDFGQLAVL